jgi:hypothetical protein
MTMTVGWTRQKTINTRRRMMMENYKAEGKERAEAGWKCAF